MFLVGASRHSAAPGSQFVGAAQARPALRPASRTQPIGGLPPECAHELAVTVAHHSNEESLPLRPTHRPATRLMKACLWSALRATVLRLAVSSSAPRKRGRHFGQHCAPCCPSSDHALPASGKLTSKLTKTAFSNVPALQKTENKAVTLRRAPNPSLEPKTTASRVFGSAQTLGRTGKSLCPLQQINCHTQETTSCISSAANPKHACHSAIT